MIQSVLAFSIVFPGSLAILFLLANCVYGGGGGGGRGGFGGGRDRY